MKNAWKQEKNYKMKIIYKPSRCGKTTELIKLASKEKYGLIVCHSRDEVNRVWYMALEMEKNKEIEFLPPKPITFQEFLGRAYYGSKLEKIYIDNADMLLQSLTPLKIDTITLTEE